MAVVAGIGDPGRGLMAWENLYYRCRLEHERLDLALPRPLIRPLNQARSPARITDPGYNFAESLDLWTR